VKPPSDPRMTERLTLGPGTAPPDVAVADGAVVAVEVAREPLTAVRAPTRTPKHPSDPKNRSARGRPPAPALPVRSPARAIGSNNPAVNALRPSAVADPREPGAPLGRAREIHARTTTHLGPRAPMPSARMPCPTRRAPPPRPTSAGVGAAPELPSRDPTPTTRPRLSEVDARPARSRSRPTSLPAGQPAGSGAADRGRDASVVAMAVVGVSRCPRLPASPTSSW
jgi:hypothetical protein